MPVLTKNDSKDLWCFNIWLEEDSLQLPLFKRTAFDALEAAQVDWIFDEANVEQRFHQLNSWMSDHLENYSQVEAKHDQVVKSNLVLRLLNELVYRLSTRHLHRKNKIPYKNLEQNQAFLHDGESHLQYTHHWQELFWLCLAKIPNLNMRGG